MIQQILKNRLKQRTNKNFVKWRLANKKNPYAQLHHLLESFMGGKKQNDYLLAEINKQLHERIHYKEKLTDDEFVELFIESLEYVFDYIEFLEIKAIQVQAKIKPDACGGWQKEKPNKPCYFIHRYNRKDNNPSLFEAVIDGGVLVVVNIQDDEFVETMEDFSDGDFFIIEKY